MRWWTLLLAVLTAALSLALVLVARENRRLRGELEARARELARAGGLEEGRALDPFTLRDADGKEVRVDLREQVGTVLLFHAAACGACEASRGFWRSAIEQAGRPDVRVLCIQTDASDGPPLSLEGLPASLAVPLPPAGWLAALPAVPATLVVDEEGVLVRAWFRELETEAAAELTRVIAALGATKAAAMRR